MKNLALKNQSTSTQVEQADLLGDLDDLVTSVDKEHASTTSKSNNVVELKIAKAKETIRRIQAKKANSDHLHSPTPLASPESEKKFKYEFPCKGDLEIEQDQYSLCAALSNVVGKITNPHLYPNYREEYCRLSILLNKVRLWAPGFRSYPVNLYGNSGLEVQNLIQRDRIIIDLHWLHERGECLIPNESTWASLFDASKPFNFEKAEQFAQRPYTDDVRANEILSIPPRLQLQLRAMREKEIEQRIKDYSTSRRQRGSAESSRISQEAIDLKAINHWADKKPVIRKHVEKHKANAKAQALMSSSLYSFSDMCELSAVMRGEKPEDLKNFKANLASFNKYREQFS